MTFLCDTDYIAGHCFAGCRFVIICCIYFDGFVNIFYQNVYSFYTGRVLDTPNNDILPRSNYFSHIDWGRGEWEGGAGRGVVDYVCECPYIGAGTTSA